MDNLSSANRKKAMKAVRATNTKPEIAVRKILHRLGFRFRIHHPKLSGRPDIVLPKYRSIIFVQGCFWHQHEGCPRSKRPATSREYWNDKLRKNVERDERNFQNLALLGWIVLEIWECELRNLESLEHKLLFFLRREAH